MNQLIVKARAAGCPPEFILLAGGTSKIPLIGIELERITGVKCRQWSDGREAIALGAAIKAHQLWGGVSAESVLNEMKSKEDKMAAMSLYRKMLETAFLDGKITEEEKSHLDKERHELGLTDCESHAIHIQILGLSLDQAVNTKLNDKPLTTPARKCQKCGQSLWDGATQCKNPKCHPKNIHVTAKQQNAYFQQTSKSQNHNDKNIPEITIGDKIYYAICAIFWIFVAITLIIVFFPFSIPVVIILFFLIKKISDKY